MADLITVSTLVTELCCTSCGGGMVLGTWMVLVLTELSVLKLVSTDLTTCSVLGGGTGGFGGWHSSANVRNFDPRLLRNPGHHQTQGGCNYQRSQPGCLDPHAHTTQDHLSEEGSLKDSLISAKRIK